MGNRTFCVSSQDSRFQVLGLLGCRVARADGDPGCGSVLEPRRRAEAKVATSWHTRCTPGGWQMGSPRISSRASDLWTIVLAAGEGTRLRALTRALHGEDLPKQFATILGRDSLLQATLRRAISWSSAEKTVVVVAEDRERLARDQVLAFGSLDVVAQPKNMGTGPGILLPLAHVIAKDPDAIVVIVPSDHYVSDSESFAASVRRAKHVAEREDTIALLAAVPEGPETQYGWILVEHFENGTADRVAAFLEKPEQAAAEELFRRGALWNTFIMVGRARHFWELARKHLESQTALFDSYVGSVGSARQDSARSALYEALEPADYSKDVLQKSSALCVVSLPPCGWSDWGTPDRVCRSLYGTQHFDELLARLGPGGQPLVRAVEPSGPTVTQALDLAS